MQTWLSQHACSGMIIGHPRNIAHSTLLCETVSYCSVVWAVNFLHHHVPKSSSYRTYNCTDWSDQDNVEWTADISCPVFVCCPLDHWKSQIPNASVGWGITKSFRRRFNPSHIHFQAIQQVYTNFKFCFRPNSTKTSLLDRDYRIIDDVESVDVRCTLCSKDQRISHKFFESYRLRWP